MGLTIIEGSAAEPSSGTRARALLLVPSDRCSPAGRSPGLPPTDLFKEAFV